jgi:hypothetical protein
MPSKIYPNWDFWFESKPSGNTDVADGGWLWYHREVVCTYGPPWFKWRWFFSRRSRRQLFLDLCIKTNWHQPTGFGVVAFPTTKILLLLQKLEYLRMNLNVLVFQRPAFDKMGLPLGVKFAPRGELCPLLYVLFTPSFTPRGEHSLIFRRTKGRTEGISPWGITSPLEANLTPGGSHFAPRGKI